MSDNERDGRRGEAIGDRQLVHVGGVEDFALKIGQRLPEIGGGDDSRIPLPDEDRHDLAGGDIEQIEPLRWHRIKERMNVWRSFFGDVALCQSTGVEVKGIRHPYSSRI